MAKTKAYARAQEKVPPVVSAKKGPEVPVKKAGPEPASPVSRARVLRFAERASGTDRARMANALQRDVGNARMGRMLRAPAGPPTSPPPTQLAVVHPQDPSEKEAEAVAQRVAAGKKAAPVTPLAAAQTLSRRAEDEEPVQAQIAAGEGKRSEEAQRQAKEKESIPAAALRRQPAEEQKPAARQAGSGVDRPDGAAAARLMARSGEGSPLNPATRSALESGLGADLGAARVHRDPAAHQAAAALKARAFTRGNDIYMARGESEGDTRLMAHEATHVVQQGAAAARSRVLPAGRATGAASPSTEPGSTIAPGVVDLKGKPTFPKPAEIPDVDRFLTEKAGKPGKVRVRFGKLAEGMIDVKKEGRGQYRTTGNSALPITHPLFAGIGEAVPQDLRPTLILLVGAESKVDGYLGLGSGKKLTGSLLSKTPELLGLVGFELPGPPKIPNRIKGGSLYLGPFTLPVRLGGAFSGSLTIEATDERVATFEGKATINVRNLAEGELELKRSAAGLVTGKAAVGLKLPKNFSGNVDVAWNGEAITGEGKVAYQGEKLSGEVIIRLMEKGEAAALEAEKKAPPKVEQAASTKKKGKPKKIDYVVFGEGDLAFAFNEWLNGTAHVIVDPKGFLTIIGKITPQKEFELFKQKDYNKELFELEARAGYGIPVVGNIFIFANVSLSAFANLGPARFYKISVEGTYSTDPKKCNDFRIQGSLNISAAAGLRLRGEAGAGLEVLAHDIKAGAGLNCLAGIRGYAEATPVIGYREKQGKEGEDKKGEFFIRGDLEVAAQPFLGLGGDLFVEIDAPWWSPVPDKKWTWPLGNKEYPLGGSFGVGASVDYVFGSDQAPAVDFKPVDFSADKFLTDLYSDKAKAKSGAGEKQGTWKEKNAKDAAPPPKAGKKGSAQPGKAPVPAPAKSKVKAGGPKKAKKPVDPNARTAEGKSVKEYQEEARKREGKLGAKGLGKGTAEEKLGVPEPAKKIHDQELKKGLEALSAVTRRYAEAGATEREVKSGVKAVRRKFKIFKALKVKRRGTNWIYFYRASDESELPGPEISGYVPDPAGKGEAHEIIQSSERWQYEGAPHWKYWKTESGGRVKNKDAPMGYRFTERQYVYFRDPLGNHLSISVNYDPVKKECDSVNENKALRWHFSSDEYQSKAWTEDGRH